MAALLSILYPKTDKEFNLKYYLESHMKLVEKSIGEYGLVDCKLSPLLQTCLRVNVN